MKNTIKKISTLLLGALIVSFLAGCPSPEDPVPETTPDLAGQITISPAENVKTGDELTATYSGTETVTYRWNKSGQVISGEV